MTETYRPELSVNRLIKKIQEEVAMNSKWGELKDSNYYLRAVKNIEAFLEIANSKSRAEAALPDRLTKFPFNVSTKVQSFAVKLILKAVKWLFRNQSSVNEYLVQAVRSSLELNQQLIEQVGRLEAKIEKMNYSLKKDNSLNYLEQTSTTEGK